MDTLIQSLQLYYGGTVCVGNIKHQEAVKAAFDSAWVPYVGFQQHKVPNDRLIKFDDAHYPQGLQISIALVLVMYCISIPVLYWHCIASKQAYP